MCSPLICPDFAVVTEDINTWRSSRSAEFPTARSIQRQVGVGEEYRSGVPWCQLEGPSRGDIGYPPKTRIFCPPSGCVKNQALATWFSRQMVLVARMVFRIVNSLRMQATIITLNDLPRARSRWERARTIGLTRRAVRAAM